MKKRVLSGIVLVIFGILLLALPETIMPAQVRYVVVAILMIIAHWEMIQALKKWGYHPIEWMGYVFSAAFFPVYLLFGSDGLWILLVLLIMAAFVQRIFSKKRSTFDLLMGLVPLFYPLSFFVFVGLTATAPEVVWHTVLVGGVLAACSTDVFALFSGMLFGKHPLAKNISPKKTVEGAIGGLIFGTLSGILLWVVQQTFWGGTYSLLLCLVSAFFGSIADQIGDLAASTIKREANIKDFGKIIPGHGGIMDRLDGVLFAIPVAYICFVMIG